MRCKNCGSENEENLYICQNCGSPLYDEEPLEETPEEMGNTRIVPVVASSSTPAQKPSSSNVAGGSNGSNRNNDNDEEQKKKTQITVIIIVLALVLVIVVGVLIGVLVHSKNVNDASESTSSSDVSSTVVSTTEPRKTTTKAPTTTEAPTTTTEPPTTTTQAMKYMVEVSCTNGGTVNGRGMYLPNEDCTVTAVADAGFEFDGWYINGKRVSSSPNYKFKVKADTNLEAVFTQQIMEQE